MPSQSVRYVVGAQRLPEFEQAPHAVEKSSAWLAIDVALIAPADEPHTTANGSVYRSGSASRAISASAFSTPT